MNGSGAVSWVRWLGVVGLLALAACDNGGGGGMPPSASTAVSSRFGFAVNTGDNTLSTFLIDASTGQWRAHGYIQTGAAPAAAATDPSGKFVYVVNKTDDTVSGFALDTTNGALSSIDTDGVTAGNQPALATGASPVALVVDPTGKFLYVANETDESVSGYSIDSMTGALSPIDTDAVTGGIQPAIATGIAPAAVTIDPLGKFLYVMNGGGAPGSVSAFAIDATAGALTTVAGSPFAAGTAPADFAMDASGKFLYVANSGSDDVSAFTIDSTTGALAAVTGSPFGTGTGSGPGAVSVNPSGKFAYVANQAGKSISIFPIDSGTGALGSPSVKTTEAGQSAMHVDPSGRYLYVANAADQLLRTYRISSFTGGLSLISAARTRTQPVALAMTRGSKPLVVQPKFGYVANSGADSVYKYSVDASTGALSYDGAASSSVSSPQPYAIAVDPFNRFVYVANYSAYAVSGYTINSASGVLTSIGTTITPGTDTDALVVDPSGRFLYVLNRNSGIPNGSVSVYSINQADGTLGTSSIQTVAVGNTPSALTIDPTGQYLYVANRNYDNLPAAGSVSVFSINPNNGLLTAATGAPAGIEPIAVSTDASGRFLYVVNGDTSGFSSDVEIFAIDASTGTLGTSIGTAPTGDGPVAIGADPKGRFMYVANYNGVTVAAYALESAGLLSTPTLTSSLVAPVAVTVDPSGQYAYATNDGGTITEYEIDPSAGVLTFLGGVATDASPRALALTMSIH
jgi:6-phosphogluconolactonase (cycloisomerase 2 family)